MARDIAKQKEQALANIDFSADADDGLGDLTSQDYAIPYLTLLQKMSPQIATHDMKAGQIFNTVSEVGYDEITVIPCAYKRNFVEWIPREQGGGLVGVHEIDSPTVAGASRVEGKLMSMNGNQLVETANHFVLAHPVDDEVNTERALIVMTSTQLKKNRRWNSLIAGIKMQTKAGAMYTPARFSHKYKLSSTLEKNEKGSWYGWNIELIGPVDNAHLYATAKDFGHTAFANQQGPLPPEQADDIPQF